MRKSSISEVKSANLNRVFKMLKCKLSGLELAVQAVIKVSEIMHGFIRPENIQYKWLVWRNCFKERCAGMYTYEGDTHICVISKKVDIWHFLVCDMSAYHFMSACQSALYRDVTDYSLILLQVQDKDGHKRRDMVRRRYRHLWWTVSFPR